MPDLPKILVDNQVISILSKNLVDSRYDGSNPPFPGLHVNSCCRALHDVGLSFLWGRNAREAVEDFVVALRPCCHVYAVESGERCYLPAYLGNYL